MSVIPKALFDYDSKEDFSAKLAEWIGQVFYDILPEHGYDVREEQIYTAFLMAEAVCNKKIHLAEAGLGTGKTFAYLLTAMAYARFSGKPVVIACASTALQEQLSGAHGDIKTLSRILGLEIDARMAKDPHQYICDVRVHEYRNQVVSDELDEWLDQTKKGERSEIPHIPDRVWKQIGWNPSMTCDLCASRGFCKLIKAREHYRPARDLIIADHDIFFEDLWTRDELIADGKLPILPNYSAVIFDEGHKVILPAAMKAGQQILKEDIDSITQVLGELQGARESLLLIADKLEETSADFFEKLKGCGIADERSERLALQVDGRLLKLAAVFHKTLDLLLFEIQIEQELYLESLPESLLQTYESQIEGALLALDRLSKNSSGAFITWIDQRDGSFWIVPRHITKMLHKHLFQKGLPVVFTSATLSNEGDFSYFSRSLGLKTPSSSTVGSAFDIEDQVVVYVPHETTPVLHLQRIEKLVALLIQNEGRSLVLTNSLEEVRKIRKAIENYKLPFDILWEDRGERGYLVRKFREEVSSVLIGASFWEGIDVPGEGLCLVVIWQLPFPNLDPMIEVQRKEAIEEGLDPLMTVDYPEMGLKLKQGCGRLIRTKDDRGAIVIMDPVVDTPWEKIVLGALPADAKIKAFTIVG